MRPVIKRGLAWVGGILPESLVWKVCMIGNYVHVGRWMKDRNFVGGVRVRRRDQVIDAMARPIAAMKVLYLEFGVFQGASMREWSKRLVNPASLLDGFDTFEGLPENWSGWTRKGELSVGGVTPVIADPRVRFFKGRIEDTLPFYQVEHHDVLVIFVDTDLYSSTSFVLKALKDHITVGTLIYFDEFAVREHELQAFDDFMTESGWKFELIAADYGMMNVAFRRIG